MSYFSGTEFLMGVATSIVASLVWLIITERFPVLSQCIGSMIEPGLNLSGFWVVSFDSEGVPGRKNIEVFRMRHFGKEKVTFAYDHYSNKLEVPYRGKGRGVFRTSYFTAVYYPAAREGTATGALVLRYEQDTLRDTLRGVYAHYRNSKDAPTKGLFISKQDAFIMHKIQMPIALVARTFLGKPYFEGYEEAEVFTRKHLTKG